MKDETERAAFISEIMGDLEAIGFKHIKTMEDMLLYFQVLSLMLGVISEVAKSHGILEAELQQQFNIAKDIGTKSCSSFKERTLH